MRKSLFFFLFFLFLMQENLQSAESALEKPENIRRKSKDFYFFLPTPNSRKRECYPWEKEGELSAPKITKEYFRCKGSSRNPQKMSDKNEVVVDCEGGGKHPLPFICGKENVYPILLDLLNYVQKKTKKRVVVTCGHRCLRHNTYADYSRENSASKHMMGAEVDFYVAGMEKEPEKIIEILQEFYRTDPLTKKQPEFAHFLRFQKATNVSILPWYNKEIFIKLYQKQEGRDFDNQHGYPYIGIQVRYDRMSQENVTFSWEKVKGPS
jgi:hypothetical protein